MGSRLANQFPDDRESFRINKLINQLPKRSRDKHGVNANLTLLNFLFKFHRGEYESLTNLEDSLKLYQKRYLQKKHNQKMTLFYDLLLTLIRNNFDAEAAQKAGAETCDKLLNTTFRYEGGYEDLEVLPFEELWEWMITNLKRATNSSSLTTQNPE